jgi:tetratricopeptide (TPR) repeat protein
LLDEAERAAKKSVSLDPELAVAYHALGMVYELRGEYSDAIVAARRAIELDPSFAYAYRLLGFYLPQVGESDEAITILDKAIRLSPRSPWLFSFLRGKGEAYFAARRYEDAVECLKQSVATGRSFGGANWFALAASLGHLDRREEAKAALQEGRKRAEWEVTATHLRRTLYYKNPDWLERYIEGLRKAGLPE